MRSLWRRSYTFKKERDDTREGKRERETWCVPPPVVERVRSLPLLPSRSRSRTRTRTRNPRGRAHSRSSRHLSCSLDQHQHQQPQGTGTGAGEGGQDRTRVRTRLLARSLAARSARQPPTFGPDSVPNSRSGRHSRTRIHARSLSNTDTLHCMPRITRPPNCSSSPVFFLSFIEGGCIHTCERERTWGARTRGVVPSINASRGGSVRRSPSPPPSHMITYTISNENPFPP